MSNDERLIATVSHRPTESYTRIQSAIWVFS